MANLYLHLAVESLFFCMTITDNLIEACEMKRPAGMYISNSSTIFSECVLIQTWRMCPNIRLQPRSAEYNQL